MTSCNADNRIKAGSAGAVEAVVAAMCEHAGHAGVQENGCRALAFMSCSDNTARMVSAGAGEAVWAALVAHPGSVAVLSGAVVALRWIPPVPADTAGPVVKTVVAAMTARLDDSSVQEAACLVLSDMAIIDAVHADTAASVIGAVLAAMAAHPGSRGVHQGACLALGSMTSVADNNKAIALEAGAGEALVASMKVFSGDGPWAAC